MKETLSIFSLHQLFKNISLNIVILRQDIFCNDLRDPSAIDYSKPIVQWLNSSKDEALQKWEYIVSGELQQKQKAVVGEVSNLQLPQFKAVEMQKTHLCDLKFQLGAGYLYCHQVRPFISLFIIRFVHVGPDIQLLATTWTYRANFHRETASTRSWLGIWGWFIQMTCRFEQLIPSLLFNWRLDGWSA